MMSVHTYKPTVRSLFDEGELITYPKNQIVIRAFEEIEHLYLIEEGYIKIYTINDRGDEQVHVVYGPGDLFPLTGLLGERSGNIFYQAMSEARIARIALPDVTALLQHDIALSYAAMQQAIEQYKVYVSRVYSLEYRFARERLAHRLIMLCNRFGVRTHEGIELRAPLTQQIIASSINLSRETVSREMERFVAKGYIKEISRSGAPLLIQNAEGLIKEIPGGPIFPLTV